MATRLIVNEVPPPSQSRLADWYDGANLLDAFAVQVPIGLSGDIRFIAELVLGREAPWFRALLRIRDGVVRPFGLRTSDDIRNADDGRSRIDFFPILSTYDDELILGEDDRHLDVRISLLIERNVDNVGRVIVTTAVRCHNRLGRAYLLAIRPFHRVAVVSYLRRAGQAGFVVTSATS